MILRQQSLSDMAKVEPGSCFFNGNVYSLGMTKTTSIAVAINMLVLLILMTIFPYFANMSGAVLAASALTLSLLVEWFFLWWQSRNVYAH